MAGRRCKAFAVRAPLIDDQERALPATRGHEIGHQVTVVHTAPEVNVPNCVTAILATNEVVDSISSLK